MISTGTICLQELGIGEQEQSGQYFNISHSHQLHDSGGIVAEQDDDTHQEPDVEGKDKLQPGLLSMIVVILRISKSRRDPFSTKRAVVEWTVFMNSHIFPLELNHPVVVSILHSAAVNTSRRRPSY